MRFQRLNTNVFRFRTEKEFCPHHLEISTCRENMSQLWKETYCPHTTQLCKTTYCPQTTAVQNNVLFTHTHTTTVKNNFLPANYICAKQLIVRKLHTPQLCKTTSCPQTTSVQNNLLYTHTHTHTTAVQNNLLSTHQICAKQLIVHTHTTAVQNNLMYTHHICAKQLIVHTQQLCKTTYCPQSTAVQNSLMSTHTHTHTHTHNPAPYPECKSSTISQGKAVVVYMWPLSSSYI
jgi:hypothetical protein